MNRSAASYVSPAPYPLLGGGAPFVQLHGMRHLSAGGLQSNVECGPRLLADIGEYRQLHESLEDGAYAFYKPTRTLNLAKDDVDRVIQKAGDCVKHIYGTIRATYPETDEVYRVMDAAFETRMAFIQNKEEVLTQLSHMIVKCITQLHVDGENLRPDRTNRTAPTIDDMQMTAFQRIIRISEILTRNKGVCIDLLNGKGAITMFVAMPIACEGVRLCQVLASMTAHTHTAPTHSPVHGMSMRMERFPSTHGDRPQPHPHCFIDYFSAVQMER